jgi:hypothetical protein
VGDGRRVGECGAGRIERLALSTAAHPSRTLRRSNLALRETPPARRTFIVGSERGETVALGREDATTRPWADTCSGQYGFAFYGHEPREEPRRSAHALCLDTGCVFGSSLSAAVLEHGAPASSAQVLSVRASRAYAAQWHRDRE